MTELLNKLNTQTDSITKEFIYIINIFTHFIKSSNEVIILIIYIF